MIVFPDQRPVAAKHLIVLSKTLSMDSLIDATDSEEHKTILGNLMVTAAKVARDQNIEGYRIVMNNGKHAFQTIHNLYVHIIGGQQLRWPPYNKPAEQEEESKEPNNLQQQLHPKNAQEQLFIYEMGFSLIMKAIIEAKKPVIGHNCMYDWIYLYNQFIGPLPETYLEFAHEWNQRFPFTYDTKVLAYNSKAFYNTSLGQIYEKCTNDDKFKGNIRCRFDTKNHCSNYDG